MKRIAANYIFPIHEAPIKNGYVELTDDGTVTSFGEMTCETPDTIFYNGILCPGFVNAHCHVELSHLAEKFKEGTGMSGFIDQINSLRDSAPQDQRINAMEVQYRKMYEEGVSAVADISNCAESFQMKSQSPIYSRTFLEVFGTETQDAPQVMNEVEKLHQMANQMHLDAAPTPHSPYTMSPELLRLASKAALREGYLSYHNQESMEEENMIKNGTGALADNYHARGLSTPPITGRPALLYFLDILQKIHKAPFKEHILLIHNTVTNEESIDRALEILSNVSWVTCPLSNIFIHKTLAPLHLFRRKGLSIAVGTDSLSSNHILSMIDEIKCIISHFPDIPLDEILGWSCLNGAKALGKEDIYGSFAIGHRPGVVLIDNIDFRSLTLTPQSTSTRII
jgi:aminodeoxyfutalosine deaminase